MKLPGHVVLDVVDEFSLVHWHVAGLVGDLVNGHHKSTLFTLLLSDLKIEIIVFLFFSHGNPVNPGTCMLTL